jgi:hypothetical protein
MKTTRSWKAFAGLVLHALLAGIMILSASGKLLGSFPPPEAVAQLGLSRWITVIGAGELAAAILLLIPRTSSRSSCRSGAPSPERLTRPQASSKGTEPSSTFRAQTSGTWKTARSRSSTATSTSCSNKWEYSLISHPRSERSGHEIRRPVSFFAQWFTYESYNTEPQTGG